MYDYASNYSYNEFRYKIALIHDFAIMPFPFFLVCLR